MQVSSAGRKRARAQSSAFAVSDSPAEADHRVGLQPDSRTCKLCGAKDCSQDPLDGGFLFWYYPPSGGRNTGMICFYCGRTWFTYYRHRSETRTLTLMVSWVGADGERHTAFLSLRGKFVEICVQGGSRLVRVNGGIQPNTPTVVSIDRREQSVEDEDQHVELNYYMTTYGGGMGDPRTNGKGHKICKLEGVWGVMVPGPPPSRRCDVLGKESWTSRMWKTMERCS